VSKRQGEFLRRKDDSVLDRPMGLARVSKHHLGWGWGHGALLNWPKWVKNIIVAVWNFIACRVYGHYWFEVPAERGWPAVERHCPMCRARPSARRGKK
jgi:hypothetical protein